MSKLNELREEVGLRMGYAMAGALIDAAQDEVWQLIEKLTRYDGGAELQIYVGGPEWWTVDGDEFPDCVSGKTLREAVESAAKELGIEND